MAQLYPKTVCFYVKLPSNHIAIIIFSPSLSSRLNWTLILGCSSHWTLQVKGMEAGRSSRTTSSSFSDRWPWAGQTMSSSLRSSSTQKASNMEMCWGTSLLQSLTLPGRFTVIYLMINVFADCSLYFSDFFICFSTISYILALYLILNRLCRWVKRLYIYFCTQGAVDSPAALWLGFTCPEDSAEGLWQSSAAREEESGEEQG